MASSTAQNKIETLSNRFVLTDREVDQRVFGEKVGLIGKIFGCWHEDMSRPFSREKIAFRSCLKCGARKQFDSETLETFGGFYFPPITKVENFI